MGVCECAWCGGWETTRLRGLVRGGARETLDQWDYLRINNKQTNEHYSAIIVFTCASLTIYYLIINFRNK